MAVSRSMSALTTAIEYARTAWYGTVEWSRKTKRKLAGPGRDTYSGIYFDIEEGLTMDLGAYIEVSAKGNHLKPDRYFKKKVWFEACFFGRVDMARLGVKAFKKRSNLKKEKNRLFWKKTANRAMMEVLRCPKPSVEVVKFLVEELGADVNYEDEKTRTTPPILVCTKCKSDTGSTLSMKMKIATYFLLEKGANFINHPWPETWSAYEEAIHTYFWRMATFLLKYLDEDCFEVMHYIRKNNFENESNWVANNLLAKQAMTNASFITRLEHTMLPMADQRSTDNVSEMLYKETDIVAAIGLAIWDAACRGLVPTNRFTQAYDPHLGKTLRNMTLEECVQFLRDKCSILLSKYVDYVVITNGVTYIDEDPGALEPLGGKYKWSELFPIIRDLYLIMWTSGKPKDAGFGEHMASEILTPTQIEGSFQSVNDPIKKLGPLPKGWILTVDPASGTTYYVHVVNQETSRSRPKANVRKLQQSSRYVVDSKLKTPVRSKKEEDRSVAENKTPEG